MNDPIEHALTEIESKLRAAWTLNQCLTCPLGELAALAAATLEFWREKQKSWAAGLFEGEGCITTNGGTYPRLAIGMTDKDILEKFQMIAGEGKLYGPYQSPSTPEGRKPKYIWAAHGPAAERVMEWLRERLGSRRQTRAEEVFGPKINPDHWSNYRVK